MPPPAPHPPPAPAAPAAPAPSDEVPAFVTAYDERVIEGKLKPFVELTKSFAVGSVIEQVEVLEKEFIDLREVLVIAGACKNPDQAEFEKLLGPLQKDIETITRMKEANRKDREWWDHLSAVAAGAPSVGWITVVSQIVLHATGALAVPVSGGWSCASTFAPKRNHHNDASVWKLTSASTAGVPFVL